MKLSEFDYEVSESQIAQHPLKDRDSSRLLILHKDTGKTEHRIFKDIVSYLEPGDVLVLNDTRVVPVRLCGTKPSGGQAEITLLEERGKNNWTALVKGMHEGTIILTETVSADVSRLDGTMARVRFHFTQGPADRNGPDIRTYLNEIGFMPLPVYIKRKVSKADEEGYQTIYAEKEGAVAAPTAGLHFTDTLLRLIKEKEIHIETVTLHVGHGTFKPVKAADIRDHYMDEECYEIPEKTAASINSARSEGRRVIAVGTTVTRTLESSVQKGPGNKVIPGRGKASLFIYPGFEFRIVDALVTNFHLPKSTPMILVSALTGLDLIKTAYLEAQRSGYRLFSYGDAMLII